MDKAFSIFDAVARRMDWLGQRQTVLAQNVANADTPHYKPQDLTERSFLQAVRSSSSSRGAPEKTHALHIDTAMGPQRDPRQREQKERYETAPSGNAVVLEEQLVKVQETQMQYAALTSLYSKQMSFFRLALTGQR